MGWGYGYCGAKIGCLEEVCKRRAIASLVIGVWLGAAGDLRYLCGSFYKSLIWKNCMEKRAPCLGMRVHCM